MALSLFVFKNITYYFIYFRYFCRSIEFDEMTKQCTLSEEDSYSQKDDLGIASSPTHHFYDLVCLDNRKYTPHTKLCWLAYLALRLTLEYLKRNNSKIEKLFRNFIKNHC